ncbi:SDR family NAD(P)-dependent oxidoreductase [Chitinophaga filiformis]|uniref:Short chain dehydrogenase n=1 Tax=Chitinophaga filiformis TaxID=104663 RepID=A0A1G7RNZ3_CHIFI|nr:SDR family oxidoreductase [Chitinophaga filiformis]SDG12538.1 short chain dehydrogenase [Chitinophaga filiformis]
MKNDFTKEEWDTCIKVLQVLSRDPDKSLDTLSLKGLVTKLYKRAKKDNKQQAAEAILDTPVVSTHLLSLKKVQKLSRRQSLLKQYDKQVVLARTTMHRKYELPDSEHVPDINEPLELNKYQRCYICKTPYKQVHFFYHMLCPTCADTNYTRRNQQANLEGRIALITGGRIKIGYLTALRMLRDGAKVWVTTRFAKDCAMRFSQEADFSAWSHRLKIVALDLRNLSQLNSFIQYLQTQEKHLDILINNAAQTIKRPVAFYRHLFEFEESNVDMLPEAVRQCLAFSTPFQFLTGNYEQQLLPHETATAFPENRYDKDRQQVDLRTSNSWSTLLQDIHPGEMLETQLVNVTAPFMLNSQLKEMMKQSPFERRFIINVSAMEGQFNRDSKTPFHPHTNMAKAALNMMTRTSAQEYAQDQIFMNSVDTGWITQENPHPKKERLYEEESFVPPLDETDGMARIYDPIARGISLPELPLFGHFLKDYLPHAW